eukprot:TRINITY_DN6969_c2_g1_i1.p1 TRINITY_DN6969_c2_g1~~TRINITY_DN6969_c2_g1_i1.p1  ORF type:complete len:245 (-),score=36.55 TRINITY_DN6969_c2_g1_i1:358-1092(-)
MTTVCTVRAQDAGYKILGLGRQDSRMEGTYSSCALDVMGVDMEGADPPVRFPFSIEITEGQLQVTLEDGTRVKGSIQDFEPDFHKNEHLAVMFGPKNVRVCKIEDVESERVRVVYNQSWNPEKHDEWLPKTSPRIMNLLGRYCVIFSGAVGPWKVSHKLSMTARLLTFRFDEKENAIKGAFRNIKIPNEGSHYVCTAVDNSWAWENRGSSDSWSLSLPEAFPKAIKFAGLGGLWREFRFKAQKD